MTNFPEPPRKENKPVSSTRAQALADLAYLWKIDDPQWMAQRKEDWQLLVTDAFDDYPKSEKKSLERYFMYGDKSEYIPVSDFFFLTPYDSTESLLRFFYSGLLDHEDRASMYLSYIFDADRFANCHWHKRHTGLFVEGILGDTYTEEIEQKSTRRTIMISPPPAMWCKTFVRFAIEAISSQDEWKPLYQCVNYFVSALPYALDERDRKRIRLPQLLQLATGSLSEEGLSRELLDFVQALKGREQEVLQAWAIGEQKIAAMNSER